MTFDAMVDLRRLLNAFTDVDFSGPVLGRFLGYGARDVSRRGLLVQQKHIIDLEVGVKSYALPVGWVQSFAIIREDIQSYLTLRDQLHGIWYLYLTPGSWELTLSNVLPAGVNLAPGESFYWFEWQSPDLATWYVYPALLGDGQPELAITDTQPAVGTGTTQTLSLRTSDQIPWLIGVSNLPEVQMTAFSGIIADLTAPAAEPKALTLMPPEGFDRWDPELPDGPPLYATVWQGRLWIYPTPDARYQLDHKHFALATTGNLAYTLPVAVEPLPVFQAFSRALRTENRLEAATAVDGIYERLLNYLAIVYRARDQQDSKEDFRIGA